MRMDMNGNRTANVGKTMEGSRFRPLSTREDAESLSPILSIVTVTAGALSDCWGIKTETSPDSEVWTTTVQRGGALWRCTVTRNFYYYYYYYYCTTRGEGRGEGSITVGLRASGLTRNCLTVDAYCTAYATQLLHASNALYYAKIGLPLPHQNVHMHYKPTKFLP
jgi:hypothetical protein